MDDRFERLLGEAEDYASSLRELRAELARLEEDHARESRRLGSLVEEHALNLASVLKALRSAARRSEAWIDAADAVAVIEYKTRAVDPNASRRQLETYRRSLAANVEKDLDSAIRRADGAAREAAAAESRRAAMLGRLEQAIDDEHDGAILLGAAQATANMLKEWAGTPAASATTRQLAQANDGVDRAEQRLERARQARIQASTELEEASRSVALLQARASDAAAEARHLQAEAHTWSVVPGSGKSPARLLLLGDPNQQPPFVLPSLRQLCIEALERFGVPLTTNALIGWAELRGMAEERLNARRFGPLRHDEIRAYLVNPDSRRTWLGMAVRPSGDVVTNVWVLSSWPPERRVATDDGLKVWRIESAVRAAELRDASELPGLPPATDRFVLDRFDEAGFIAEPVDGIPGYRIPEVLDRARQQASEDPDHLRDLAVTEQRRAARRLKALDPAVGLFGEVAVARARARLADPPRDRD